MAHFYHRRSSPATGWWRLWLLAGGLGFSERGNVECLVEW